MTETDRKNIHVLIVKNKYVLHKIINLHFINHAQSHQLTDYA